MTEKIRIVLIDDHTLFRSGIKALLARQENYEVVGEAADGLSGVKNINANFLIDAIGKAANGDNVFSPEMMACMVQSLIRPAQPATESALDTLTSRELEVLRYLAVGYSNKIIAKRMDLAESTVKVHVQNILRKLELGSRVQAAVYAVQHKLPLPDEEEEAED